MHHHRHTGQPREVHQQGQHRHYQYPGQDARQHQHHHGINTHDAERVHFLIHCHGAEFGSEGGTGAPGQYHASQQRPQFAQQRDAYQIGHKNLRPKTLERDGGLIGQDKANQKTEQ